MENGKINSKYFKSNFIKEYIYSPSYTYIFSDNEFQSLLVFPCVCVFVLTILEILPIINMKNMDFKFIPIGGKDE